MEKRFKLQRRTVLRRCGDEQQAKALNDLLEVVRHVAYASHDANSREHLQHALEVFATRR